MYLVDTLVACPSCSCHARPAAIECPHCGAQLRREDGTTPRTAGAILLGLIVATAGCSGNVQVGGAEGSTGASSSGESSTTTTTTGASGTTTTTGASGTTTTTTTTTTTAKPPFGCGGSFSGADYGLPPTTCSHDAGGGGGTGGQGGH